ncbi:hypothetical protein M1105_01415 [Limibaculum sp. FT325]|uniref:hypothetical protein n=1 Tax=Thermohalobaculum sediminis TaxID=2939436 RepID=UPI0020BE8276|nr:hypothetical protein [Limibaculum sediminis]MCL5775654.1 hypothetical protein [Limibaculum sediminis]
MAETPRNVDEIKKNPKMMAAYLAYAKRRATLNEVMFYFDKGNAQGVWPKYLDPKAKLAVNVDGKVTTAGGKLAAAGDWGNALWPKIIALGKTQVGDALNGDIGTFVASNEYKEYQVKENMGDPTKAAKVLGISDVKKLKAAMEAQATGDTKTAKKLFEALAKQEKMKVKYEDMVKNLKSSGVM